MDGYGKSYEYEIRAHHGMCLAFFEGKGYSSGFVGHMQDIKDKLSENPRVCLMDRTDEICSFCPNNKQGDCISREKVSRYDKEVFRLCGLQAGTLIDWQDFTLLVEERILRPGNRAAICGDCQWNAMCH